jgi:alpha-tubulin suppressor-like RCC1 family protein
MSAPTGSSGKPSGFRDVKFSQQHTAILTDDGEVYTYGKFSAEPRSTLSAVSSWFTKSKEDADAGRLKHVKPEYINNQRVQQIGVGIAHTCLLTESGQVYTWGFGGSFMNSGALGHSTTDTLLKPKLLEKLRDHRIVKIASGSWHNLALTSEGKVYAWGRGEYGRLGTGSATDVREPVLLEGLQHEKVQDIRSGTSFNAVITDNGTVYTFGRNNAGQLGLGAGLTLDTYSLESVPSQVEFDLDTDPTITQATDAADAEAKRAAFRVIDIDCGYRHAVAVDSHNHVWYWGQTRNFTPLLIKGDDSKFLQNPIVRVAAGKNFSAAIDKYGHLFTWGDGSTCCLGHGNKESVKWPKLVNGFGYLCLISDTACSS